MAVQLTVADSHIEMDPENVIEFLLTKKTTTTTEQQKVTLTLKNLDKDALPIAFKVKTTQPRRYLVRPNQGLLQPGTMEVIQIVLVDKDRNEILRNYEQMGSAVLENCKDKFLVQSVALQPKDIYKYDTYESITDLWSSNPSPVANHKLHVRHAVIDVSNDSSKDSTPIMANSARTIPKSTLTTNSSSNSNLNEMTMEQLQLEIVTLRRKYDELISFSVNLTAERDMISNTLEVTKRDLQRMMNNPNSSANSSKMKGSSVSSTTKSTSSSSSSSSFSILNFLLILVFVLLSFVMGIYLQLHHSSIIQQIPYLQTIFPVLSSPNTNKNDFVTSATTTTSSSSDEL